MKSFFLVFVLSNLLMACAPISQHDNSSGQLSTEFAQEGQLTLYVSGQPLSTLVMEIADNEAQILRGLMFREHLDADQGMLLWADKN